MKIAFLYEHPEWSRTLIECLTANGHEIIEFRISGLTFDPDDLDEHFDLAINRINIMPSATAAPGTNFQGIHFLACLEASGIRVINGSRSHSIGLSKAMQNALFSSLRLHHPRAIAIHRADDALMTADMIGYPIVFKPNVGGSGQGIERFDMTRIRVKIPAFCNHLVFH